MTSIAAAIKAILVADDDEDEGGVATLLTGGIYTKADTGPDGINQVSTPDAFDEDTLLLLPSALICARGQIPTGVRNRAAQYTSTRQVVEIYLYNHSSYAVLYQARTRIYKLLQDQRFTSVYGCHLVNQIDDERAEELDNATLIRADYQIVSFLSVG